MTRLPDHDAAYPDRTPGASGAEAAREFAADIVASVNLDAVDAQLAQWPATALLHELEAVVAAIESVDPGRQRRRTGFWGRLLGRDLVAQAQPDPVITRVRLGLAAAQAHAGQLTARSAELERLSSAIQQQAHRLARAIADERARLTGSAPVESAAAEQWSARHRRLDHLEAIVASWHASVAHMTLVNDHADQLLARYAQVRDLLVSLWREQNAAKAISAHLDPASLDRLRSLTPASLRSSIPPDPPTKEPSP